MSITIWLICLFSLVTVLAYHAASRAVVVIALGSYFLLTSLIGHFDMTQQLTLWGSLLVATIPFIFAPLRRTLFSRQLYKIAKRSVPELSATEQAAIKAGNVGFEADLFSGNPDWAKLLDIPMPQLSSEELTFLNGPVNELAAMIDNWDIIHNRCDLPPKIWQFLKRQGFFGLVIPKEFDGHGFSTYGTKVILEKIAGMSFTIGSIVGVPNSLGPGELLLHYGTDEQRKHYLPRLAKGEDVPCFALTSPEAGSDAASITDKGIVCYGQFRGEDVIGIRLQWDKRYITLAPIATLLGLAFKLYDPEHLLGSQDELGITCALVPTHLAGISIGRRHSPLGMAFPNGPTQGDKVFIPLDFIIGGQDGAGRGWEMLMQCLAAGRAVTLPATNVASSKVATASSTAYARIRRQFGVPIADFGGVSEKLSEMVGWTYQANALQRFCVAEIDAGIQSGVASAICKYQVTELTRRIINHAMDVQAGKGICLGPNNFIGHQYQGMPISITVEGANILTRNVIIFGQGCIRCHPHVLPILSALEDKSKKAGLKNFDREIFKWTWRFASNKARAFLLGISNGRLNWHAPRESKRQFQVLARLSSAYAILTDVCLLVYGKKLKRAENISARLGDILGDLYMMAAVLKNHIDAGSPAEDKVIVDWVCASIAYHAEQTLHATIRNIPSRFWRLWLRIVTRPLGLRCKLPKDAQQIELTKLATTPTAARERLLNDLGFAEIDSHPLYQLHQTWERLIAVEPLLSRMRADLKTAKQHTGIFATDIANALELGVVTDAEAQMLRVVDTELKKVIAVDDFETAELNHVKRSQTNRYTRHEVDSAIEGPISHDL